MIPINKHMTALNTISSGLVNDINDLRNNKLTVNKANAISRVSCQAIKAIAQGVMLANHQQIQRDKILMHQKEIDVKKEHIQLQRDKLNKLNKSS